MAKLAEPMVHGCGQSFTWTQAYVRHAKKCDGTKPATSGRIVNPGTGSNQHKKRDEHLPPTYPFAKHSSSSSTSSEAKKAGPTRTDPPRGQTRKKGRTRKMGTATKTTRHSAKRARTVKRRSAKRGQLHVRVIADASQAVRELKRVGKAVQRAQAISPAAFIAALEAEKAKLDTAIAAVRALA